MSLNENIHRWFKEKWTAQDGSDCGSYKGKGRVKCRPSKRVNSKTAQTWGEMSKKEKKKAVRLKQRAHKKGHQFSSHKTGKTWKGHKYSPKKKLKEGVDVDSAFLKNFMMDAIKNPKKFYAVLTLAGINSVEATKIIYNLKHPRLTSSNFATKMKMLALLQNIIELITHDRILYSRVRSMAMSGDFGRIAKNVINPDKIRKHPTGRLNIVDEDAAPGAVAPTNSSPVGQTSIGNAEIAFVAPSSENPPAPLRGVPVRKRNIPKNIMDRLKDLFRKQTKKPKGGLAPNIVTQMGQ
jgi:hypothetical protein